MQTHTSSSAPLVPPVQSTRPGRPERPGPRIVSATVSAYAFILFLCPPGLRVAYSAQMAQVFRQCCRDAHARDGARGVARLWLPTFADLLAAATAEYGTLLVRWWLGGSPAQRARTSTITVLCAYSLFVIAGFGFAKMPEHGGVAEAVHAHPMIGLAYTLTAAGSLVALLAVLAGGLPLAIAALRAARATRRRDVPLLFAVPPLALAAFVGVTVLMEWLTPGSSRAALFFVGALVLTVLASAGAVSAAIARGNLGVRILTYARMPAALVALAMSAMLACTITWGLVLRVDAPRLLAGIDATGAYGVFTWSRVVALMALATLVAFAGVGRGLAPRRGRRMRV